MVCVRPFSPVGEREPSPYLVIAQVSGEESKDSVKFDNSTVKMTFETQVNVGVVVCKCC